eukprot:4688414-Amphidinium_carterae.1
MEQTPGSGPPTQDLSAAPFESAAFQRRRERLAQLAPRLAMCGKKYGELLFWKKTYPSLCQLVAFNDTGCESRARTSFRAHDYATLRAQRQ